MRDVFGHAVRAIDLRRPFRNAGIHAAIVDFLECFTVDEIAAHLPDQHDDRRRILRGGVDADRRIGGSRATRHDCHAGTAGELAVGIRHVSRAAFLTAHDEFQAIGDVVERIEDRQIAFARDTEKVRGSLSDEIGDENLAARAHGHRR